MTSTLLTGVRFAFLAAIAIFFAMPIVVVAGVSFNNSSQMLFPPQDWSWRWYIEFFTNPNWYEPLYRSIWIALASAVLSSSIALPIAYVLWRSQTWLSKLFAGLGMLPFVIPSVVVAIVFLLF
jgi:putative spermidine/putrescine transport system permease protein